MHCIAERIADFFVKNFLHKKFKSKFQLTFPRISRRLRNLLRFTFQITVQLKRAVNKQKYPWNFKRKKNVEAVSYNYFSFF